MVSHERLDAIIAVRAGSWPALRRAGDRWRLSPRPSTRSCAPPRGPRRSSTASARPTSGACRWVWTCAPSARTGATRRSASASPPAARRCWSASRRLSTEKRPLLAIEAFRQLSRRTGGSGRGARGRRGGPLRPALEQAAAGLNVTFLGHVEERAALAALYASADVALSLGPVETFGLAALEALASGTPVVAARTGAVAELLGPGAGVATFSHPSAVASGVRAVLSWSPPARRAAAGGGRRSSPGRRPSAHARRPRRGRQGGRVSSPASEVRA